MKATYGIKQVFTKEIREFARDRRVLQASVVMPVFIIMIFVMIMGVIQRSVVEKPDLSFAVYGADDPEILQGLEQSEDATVVQIDSWEEGVQLLRDKEVRLVIDFSDFSKDKVKSGNARVRLGYSQDDPLSMIALGAAKQKIAIDTKDAVKMTFAAKGIDPSLAEPIQLEDTNVSAGKGMGGSNIVALLPYLIVLWAFYGGMSIVADLVAGEKERGTMETLLVSPIRRAAVAIGKTLALMVVCFIGSLTTLAAVFLVGALNLPVTKALFPTGLSIQPVDVLAALGLLFSLVSFFATMLVAICAKARNIREAQTLLGVLSFVIILPAIFSQVIGFTGMERAVWVQWTPVLNTAVQLKSLISGEQHYGALLPAMAVNFVLAAIFLRMSMRLFRREEILLRV